MLAQLQSDLDTEWKVLQAKWESARERWRDAAADNFDREFWSEWDSAVPELLDALREIEEMSETALRSTDHHA